jgi:hypothetical protein
MICAASRSGRMAPSPAMEKGRGLRRSHHRVGRRGARILRRRQGTLGFELDRRAGLGRPGRRRERRADRHVRRRCRRCSDASSRWRKASRRAVQPRWAPPGAGQLAKMVNQICIAGIVQGLSEGRAFRQEGRARHRSWSLDHLSKGAAQSWQMENRVQDHGRRQVRLRLRGRLDAQGPGPGAWPRRSHNGAPPPLSALVDQFYGEVQKMGGKPLGHVQPRGPAGEVD